MAKDEDVIPAAGVGGAWASIARISLMLLVVFVVLNVWMMWNMTAPREVTPRTRHTMAWAEISEIGKAVGIHFILTGRLPASLDDLRRPLPEFDGESIIDFSEDPWGRPYRFTVDGPRAVTITCLGADGEPGGSGEDEDIVVHWPAREGQGPR